jgi:catechol 2,3-dioxygenase-like lactoylglutathione lyase family enzyme
MALQRLTHIGICVSDLVRSRRFYCNVLGFIEVGALSVSGDEASTLLEIDDVELEAMYLERDGVRIELLYYPTHAGAASDTPVPMNQPGFTHLSFRVEDLVSTAEALVKAGGRLLEHTRIDNPKFRADAVFLTDPDGTRIELVEAPGDPSGIPGSGRD